MISAFILAATLPAAIDQHEHRGEFPPRSGSADACSSLEDGQHVYYSPDDEVIAARTCSGGRTVGYCDFELTRLLDRLSLERCQSVTRQFFVGGDFSMGGHLDIRVGGTLPRYELAYVSAGKRFTLKGELRPWLSGPFNPKPTDRFVIARARSIVYAGPRRVFTPDGGSFAVELGDGLLTLTDYQEPDDGFRYAPVRVSPYYVPKPCWTATVDGVPTWVHFAETGRRTFRHEGRFSGVAKVAPREDAAVIAAIRAYAHLLERLGDAKVSNENVCYDYYEAPSRFVYAMARITIEGKR